MAGALVPSRPAFASSTPPEATAGGYTATTTAATVAASKNEVLGNFAFVSPSTPKDPERKVLRNAPPSGAKFRFPDGTWTNQDYKATPMPRLPNRAGTTYTMMTPKGRSREFKSATTDHREHPSFWGLSKSKQLDERHISYRKSPDYRPGTDYAEVRGRKKRDPRDWFLLDEEGRKWDMRLVSPRIKHPFRILDMSYSDFWVLLQEGHIDKVKYTGDRNHLWVWTKVDSPKGCGLHRIGLPYDPTLYEELIKNDVKVEISVLSPALAVCASVFKLGLPLFIVFFFYRAMLAGEVNEWDPFNEADHSESAWNNSKLSLKDIGGLEDIQPEIEEVIDYLRFPNKYSDVGATPPAGVLLTGPPGCGKTLLAQCIAGEARTPFMNISSSNFDALFEGSGSQYIRSTFDIARRLSPCIIFIDEIDGVGSRRADAFDDRTQTINQMLTELDGFERNHGVVLLAATNRPDAMDEALTRPGRIDKVIEMPPPKLSGRVEIMKIHAEGKILEADFDFDKLARATSGYTGAEIKRLINDAAAEVLRKNRKEITVDDCLREIAKSEEIAAWDVQPGYFAMYSPDAKIAAMSDLFKKSCAVYEAGKVLITNMLEDFDGINKTILFPQGASVTRTFFLPQEQYMDTGTYTRRYVENRLIMHVAGLAAQELVLGRHNIVENPSVREDIRMANVIARQMVLRMGFNKRVGPVSLMSVNDSIRGRELSEETLDTPIADMSPEMAELVTNEIKDLIDAAQAKAYYGIIKNYKGLCRLSRALQVKRFMTGEAMTALLEENGLHMFGEDEIDEFGFFDDNRLKIPVEDPVLQRVIDGVVRGRRLGMIEDPNSMMADPRKVDATKDLMAWILAGGSGDVDLVERGRPLDPWTSSPSPFKRTPFVPQNIFPTKEYGANEVQGEAAPAGSPPGGD